jgi:exopolyphosphatase/guanosine-5'-triphosphate,3'-diphosphate pyrophosphatase
VLLGVLDIGSNSAQLQVFEVCPGAPPLPTHAVKEPTLLGEAFDADGAINPAGIDRVITAARRAMNAARQLGVQQLYVFATSAVRDAPNRDLILDRVEAAAGVRPQFLTGADEGRLTYLAVHQWYGWSAGRQLVLDIGGGSMEIVFGRDAEPELSISLPLGAGRLTRAFLTDDPPARHQLAALRMHVKATLREVADRLLWEGVPDRVIGTSKTFKQLARLSGSPAQRKGPFARRSVTAADLQAWIPKLAGLPARQRAKLQGVSRPRSRQILAGAMVARATMKALNVNSVDVCPWALREGIVLHYLQTTHTQSFDLPLRPLAGPPCQHDRPGPRSDSPVALAAAQGRARPEGIEAPPA